MPNVEYDRDNLIALFAERAVFERSAVTLYDGLIGAIEDVDHPVLVSSMDALLRHRDEEEVHVAWVEELLAKLGGRPQRALSDAVTREARALGQVIEHARGTGALLPMFHAMLSSELMDLEGWRLLLDVARDHDDGRAVTELASIVAREEEHLALVRHVIYTLVRESVAFPASAPRTDGGAQRNRPRRGARAGNGHVARHA
jgi:bacterioferritin (cytochrome b1)